MDSKIVVFLCIVPGRARATSCTLGPYLMLGQGVEGPGDCAGVVGVASCISEGQLGLYTTWLRCAVGSGPACARSCCPSHKGSTLYLSSRDSAGPTGPWSLVHGAWSRSVVLDLDGCNKVTHN